MRRHTSLSPIFLALTASLASCSSMREAMEGHQDIVASAAGLPLTIEMAAGFTVTSLPQSIVATENNVDEVVDVWVNCALLAAKLASPEDFTNLDMGPLAEDDLTQVAVRRLQEALILTKVDSSDAALRSAYEREQPFLRVEARHIFLSTSGVSEAELDSLAQVAETIRERAIRGEDFGQLARDYSDDPTSAPQGGYLGWVDRGHLLAELDVTLLAMHPGEISETVRTGFGYHIFKVIDVDSPDFESVRDDYRGLHVQRRIADLQVAFMDSLVEAADVSITQGAVELLRRLARSMQLRRLSAVSRGAVLARYRGGALTVDDWMAHFKGAPFREQRRIAAADSATIHDLLIQIVQDKLIEEAATELGYTVYEYERSSYVDAAHRTLRTLASQLGLNRQDLVDDRDSLAQATDRAVRNAIANHGEIGTVRRMSMPLFQEGTVQVYEDRYPAVLEQVSAIRQERGQ